MNHLEEIILDSGINSIIHLLELKKIAFSRLQIRSLFLNKFKKGIINFYDISISLEKLGIQNSGYNFSDISELKNEFLPAISYAYEKKANANEFIVITKIDSDFIYFIDNLGEIRNEKKTIFKPKWKNIILKVTINKKTTVGYLPFLKKENLEKDKYLKSIKTITNFLTDNECKFIIDFCKKNQLFKKSTLTIPISLENKKSHTYESSYRTSESSLINNINNAQIESICKKVQSLLKVKRSQIENMQCVRYKKNTYFSAHFDSNELLNRKYTLLIYLNDDFSGGETYFPELKKSINPKKGTALLFKNFNSRKNNIVYSLHEGLPVTMGIKYACNIWIKGK